MVVVKKAIFMLCFSSHQDSGQQVTDIWEIGEIDYIFFQIQKWQSMGVRLGEPQGTMERVWEATVKSWLGVRLA